MCFQQSIHSSSTIPIKYPSKIPTGSLQASKNSRLPSRISQFQTEMPIPGKTNTLLSKLNKNQQLGSYMDSNYHQLVTKTTAIYKEQQIKDSSSILDNQEY
jgi:hypothetical protein